MKKQRTKELVEIALFAAVLCVIAPFTIPVPVSPVPLSLATFGVYLAAVLLGAKRGACCVLVYLLLGMIGLPVFSGFNGGIGVLAGPTGGYLLGYVLCAWIVGWLVKKQVPLKKMKSRGRQVMWNMFAMTLGTLVCYTMGTTWFLVVMSGSYTVTQALLVCVVPYLVFDFIKVLAAAMMAEPVKIIRR